MSTENNSGTATESLIFKMWLVDAMIDGGKREEAKDEARRLLGAYPNDPWMKMLAANVMFNLDDIAAAKELIENALRLDPDLAPAHTQYAMLLQMAFHDRQGAKEHYLKAVELDDGETAAHAQLGYMSMEDEDYAAAKLHLETAASGDDGEFDARLHEALGEVFFRMEEYDEARTELERALEIDPERSTARQDLAIIMLTRFDDREGAKREFLKGVDLDPENAQLRFMYGHLLLEAFGDADGALEQFTRAVELQPGVALYHTDMAGTLGMKNDVAGARRHIDIALTIDPDSASSHGIASMVSRQERDFDQAVSHLEKVLELRPDDVHARHALAQILMAEKGDYAAARCVLEEIVALDAKDEKAHYFLALMLDQEFADFERARVHYEALLTLGDKKKHWQMYRTFMALHFPDAMDDGMAEGWR
jgi:tetratricopeptide (TPR) repeat protein